MDMLLQALAQGLLMGGTYGMVALGMGLIYGVSSIVNFSHGDFLSLGMFLCFSLYAAFALDPYVSLVFVFPALAALGALVYRFLIRPIVGNHLLMIIQLTLGLSFLLQNGLLMVYGGQPLRTPSFMESKLLILGDVVVRMPLVIAFAASIGMAGMLYFVLTRTDLGRSIRAVQQNAKAAALMGVNVSRVQLLTFAFGIALLAVAAVLLLPGTPIHPNQGMRYTVITLMTVVLGGMSNFAGILLGGLVIGLAEAIGTIYVSGVSGMILPYFIFVLIMLFRPAGLLERQG
ncbi:MAG: branched-chain amino acid ABC transporter permease [Acidobacteriota bacterium]|jgi:branched-chain amino acid transport system permease protein